MLKVITCGEHLAALPVAAINHGLQIHQEEVVLQFPHHYLSLPRTEGLSSKNTNLYILWSAEYKVINFISTLSIQT